ncbi:hypothetical protein H9P43_010061 [Blastocladiella emersonii ATCC 22665]|nr:hypothetical protein H9P43_010061 [Blastocladiella emersonii ATCC 22665]
MQLPATTAAASPAGRTDAKRALNARLAAARATDARATLAALAALAAAEDRAHADAAARLHALHATLAARLHDARRGARPFARRLAALATLADAPAHRAPPPPVLADLLRLCRLRARIDCARLALADARRWASLAATMHALDPHDAARVFVDARADLDRLAAFLPPAERLRRERVLDELRALLWALLAPRVESALRDHVPADVAALYALANAVHVQDRLVDLYARLRADEILRASNGLVGGRAGLLDRLGDVLDRDHATLPLLHSDRIALLLALTRRVAAASVPLPSDAPADARSAPADPEDDVAFLVRAERLLGVSEDAAAAVRPLLDRIAVSPAAAESATMRTIDAALDSVTLASSDPASILSTALPAVASAASATAAMISAHRAACGNYLVASALRPAILRIWNHLALRVTRILRRIHYLDLRARLPPGNSDSHAPRALDLFSALLPDALARYAAALGPRLAQLLIERARAADADLAIAADTPVPLPTLLVAHLAELDHGPSPTIELAKGSCMACAADVVRAGLEHSLEYFMAPIAGTLRHAVLAPLHAAPALASRPSTPATPSSSSARLPTSALMVGHLPQFSQSPSSAATTLGEFLLQLPHHLEAFAAVPRLPGSDALAFDPALTTLAGTLLNAAPAGTPYDLLETVSLLTQLQVVLEFHAAAVQTPIPAPALEAARSSHARKPSGSAAAAGSLASAITSSRPSSAAGTASVPSSASTSRLSSLSSTVAASLGLPASLSMRTGLTDTATATAAHGSNALAHHTQHLSPRSATSPVSLATAAAAGAPPPPVFQIDAAACDQLALDLAYLGNILTSLDAAPRAEWTWLVAALTASRVPAPDVAARLASEISLSVEIAEHRPARVRAALKTLLSGAPGSAFAFASAPSRERPSSQQQQQRTRASEWWDGFAAAVEAAVPISSGGSNSGGSSSK